MELIERSRGIGELLRTVRMVAMDVDGVMTDGGMYYADNGAELKKFNTTDGMGLQLIREAGIKTAIISGEDTEITRRRAAKLRVRSMLSFIPSAASIAPARTYTLQRLFVTRAGRPRRFPLL